MAPLRSAVHKTATALFRFLARKCGAGKMEKRAKAKFWFRGFTQKLQNDLLKTSFTPNGVRKNVSSFLHELGRFIADGGGNSHARSCIQHLTR